jgi:hypothetical protein
LIQTYKIFVYYIINFYCYKKIRSCIQIAKESLKNNELASIEEEISPCSSNIEVHISWDFAEQIHLPCSTQQVVT